MSICLSMTLPSLKRASLRKLCNKWCWPSRLLLDTFTSAKVYSSEFDTLHLEIFNWHFQIEFSTVHLRLRHRLAHSRQSSHPSGRSKWEVRRRPSISIRLFRGLGSRILFRMSIKLKMREQIVFVPFLLDMLNV